MTRGGQTSSAALRYYQKTFKVSQVSSEYVELRAIVLVVHINLLRLLLSLKTWIFFNILVMLISPSVKFSLRNLFSLHC